MSEDEYPDSGITLTKDDLIAKAVEKVIEKSEVSLPILVTSEMKPTPSISVNVGTYEIVFHILDDGELHIYTEGATPPLSIILPKKAIDTLRQFIK